MTHSHFACVMRSAALAGAPPIEEMAGISRLQADEVDFLEQVRLVALLLKVTLPCVLSLR